MNTAKDRTEKINKHIEFLGLTDTLVDYMKNEAENNRFIPCEILMIYDLYPIPRSHVSGLRNAYNTRVKVSLEDGIMSCFWYSFSMDNAEKQVSEEIKSKGKKRSAFKIINLVDE